MSFFRRFHWPLALRVFVLALLVCGAVMEPVLAAACESNQSPASAGEYRPAAAADAGAIDACCAAQECGDCCTHAPVLASQTRPTMDTRLNAGPLPLLSVEFEPIAYPVPFRPPITT